MKTSTVSVDKIPVWRVKRDAYLAARVPLKNPNLTPDGREINLEPPLVVNVYLPSMEKRIAMYEAAGAMRQAQLYGLYDEILGEEDDLYGSDAAFMDHMDEVPARGISPYEIAARPKKPKASPATPLPDGGAKPLPTSVATPSEAPKEPK